MKSPARLLLFSLVALACVRDSGVEKADLVLLNANLVTLDEELPRAQALAVSGGRILAVGTNEKIRTLVDDKTQVLDLEGHLTIPGFIEGHGHFLALGRSLAELDLTTARSWGEVLIAVRQAASTTPAGEWILGRGWHQAKWDRPPERNVEGLPYHDGLSEAVPDNPVLLTHASGHAVFANRRAMELAGVDDSTPDPPGGEIVRDAEDHVIGVFRENAAALFGGVSQDQRNEESVRNWIELASRECLENGVTSFQDAGSSIRTIELFEELDGAGELRVRLWVMVRAPNKILAEALPGLREVGDGQGFLSVRAIKRSIDGALGTHGAWLLEPYDDLPSSRGMNTTSLAELRETARLAAEYEFQLCVHAIGDRGNRETLDLFEEAFAGDPERDWRWRIEHAQHLDSADIDRFAELGVIASMQGVHCTSDGPWVPARLGPVRSQAGAYVWRSLLDSGARVINGTDTPVERINPLASFYASVTRQLADGSRFYPEQSMSREEALRSYTLDAAFASFEETEKGSLSVGKLADIVVLSRDILRVQPAAILETEVLYTIVGGRILYSHD